jgi:hypothetical protein
VVFETFNFVVIFDSYQSMDRLPRVLRNEIFEYVHGDRAHWKNEFRYVLWEVKELKRYAIDYAKMLKQGVYVTNFMPGQYTRLMGQKSGTWLVNYTHHDGNKWTVIEEKNCVTLAEAQHWYHEYVARSVKIWYDKHNF